MIRVIMGKIIETTAEIGKRVRATFEGRADETLSSKPIFGMAGFRSRPRKGSRCIAIRDGELFVILGGDDTRYSIALEEGDAIVYADEKNYIRLKGDGSGIAVYGTKIELAGSAGDSVKKLVNEEVLSLLADHVHDGPISASLAVLKRPVLKDSYTTQIVEAC